MIKLCLPLIIMSVVALQDSRPASHPATWPALDPKVKAEMQEHEKAARTAMREKDKNAAVKEWLLAANICKAGGSIPDVADGLATIADRLGKVSDWKDSLQIHRDCLQIRRALWPGGHEKLAQSLVSVAACLDRLGKRADALGHNEEALVMRRSLFEGDHMDVAESLNNVAAGLVNVGKYPEALLKFEELLAMTRRLFNGDHPVVAITLDNYGACLEAAGKSAEGLAFAEEAYAMRKRLFKGDHPDTAASMNNIANKLQSLGKGDEALARFEEAYAMFRRLHPEDDPEVATSLDNIALCLQSLDRLTDAMLKYEEGLAMCRRLFKGDHPELAKSLNNYGFCLKALGRNAEALSIAEEVLAMRKRMYKGNHPDVAESLNNVAAGLRSLGKSAEAMPYYEQSLAMYRRLHKGDHPRVALVLRNLASCLNSRGRYIEALSISEEALAMSRRIYKGDHPDVASETRAVASCLLNLGKLDASLAKYEESLAMCRRIHKGDHSEVASALNGLAYCLEFSGKSATALPYYEEALALRQRLFNGDHPSVAMSLNNIASSLRSLGKRTESLQKREEALAMERRISNGDSGDLLLTIQNAAVDRESLGKTEEALANYREAVAMARRLQDKDTYISETNLGRLLLQTHDGRDTEEAVALLTHAFEELESLASTSTSLRSEDRLHFFWQLGKWNTSDALQHALFVQHDPIRQFNYLERARSRAGLDAIAQLDKDPVSVALAAAETRMDETLASEIRAIPDLLSNQNAIITDLTSIRDSLDLRKDLDTKTLAKERSRLDDELGIAHLKYNQTIARRARILRDNVSLVAVALPEEVQATLQNDESLLAYNFSRTEGYCIVVPPTGGSIRAFELHWKDGVNVNERDLNKLTSAYLAMIRAAALERHETLAELSLATNRGLPTNTPPRTIPGKASDRGAALFEGLIPDEIWKEIKNCKRVYIVPDGPLHLLPMESLITKRADKLADCEYWLDSGPPIVYVPSGSVLKVLKERRDARKKEILPFDVLAMGDPVLPKAAASRPTESKPASAPVGAASRPTREFLYKLDPLPGSKREVETIERSLASTRKVKTLLGENATKMEVAKFGPQARVLHFATHHIPYATDSVNLSTLILSPARDGSDEGLLTMADLVDPWRGTLPNCELVVLAGCSTGKGEYLNNEGMYAIPMGFFFAGAPAVVSTLWPVDDASTADFMADFYKQWLSPKDTNNNPPSKIDAFTAARRLLKKERPEPYFWAPFIMMGDPR